VPQDQDAGRPLGGVKVRPREALRGVDVEHAHAT
jgi:hypothetical protein